MLNVITIALKTSSDVKLQMIDSCASDIEHAIEVVIGCLQNKGKILVFGNGGSAADAQHFAAEIVGRFYKERMPLPAIALTTDTSILTSVGNDYGFDKIFSRQIGGLATPDDVVIGISTSGNSANILAALKEAKEIGCKVIILTGENACSADEFATVRIKVPSTDTPRIQEGHIVALHIIAMLVEKKFTITQF